MIPINYPIYGQEEKDAVNKVLDSQLLTVSAYSYGGGPMVQEFEKQLASFCNTKHACAVSSGTSAIETSLLALNIGYGDKVILPSLTFVATANAVKSVGATPIFCDVDDDGQLDYNCAKKLSKEHNTICIIFVDLYGRISKDAKKFKDLVPYTIEDACQALGTPSAGTHGDVGCFSFYASKVMTTFGMGGAVVTNSNNFFHKLKLKRNQGIFINDCKTLGRNNIMEESNAAFGIEQLKKLPKFIKIRNKNMKSLGLGNGTNGYIGTILRNNRDTIKLGLSHQGIQTATYYDKPIHHHSFYHGDYDLPMTEIYAQQVLNLPVHPNVTPEAIEIMKGII